jgi:hypothetical protein
MNVTSRADSLDCVGAKNLQKKPADLKENWYVIQLRREGKKLCEPKNTVTIRHVE